MLSCSVLSLLFIYSLILYTAWNSQYLHVLAIELVFCYKQFYNIQIIMCLLFTYSYDKDTEDDEATHCRDSFIEIIENWSLTFEMWTMV